MGTKWQKVTDCDDKAKLDSRSAGKSNGDRQSAQLLECNHVVLSAIFSWNPTVENLPVQAQQAQQYGACAVDQSLRPVQSKTQYMTLYMNL